MGNLKDRYEFLPYIEYQVTMFLFKALMETRKSKFCVYFDEFIYGWYDFDYSRIIRIIEPTRLNESEVREAIDMVNKRRIFNLALDPKTNLYTVNFYEDYMKNKKA